MSDLKPCPFCGGEAVLDPTYDMYTGGLDGWFAWCDNDTCECKPETGQFFTKAEAIAAWNSRAERTCKNVDDHKTVWFICSVCGYQQKLSHTRSYCPNCGARVVE